MNNCTCEIKKYLEAFAQNLPTLAWTMQPQSQQRDHAAVSLGNLSAINQILEEQKARIRDAYQQVQMVDCGFTDTETPNDEQKRLKRQELGLSPDVTHIAVAGASGKGRTVFVQLVSQYTDSERVKWHDIPGAGTQGTGYIDYFHKQGLYAYDVIIILMGDRVTDIDVGLALMSHRCGLPHIFIRMGSDKLIDDDELQMAEATEIIKERRREIFSHLRKTLWETHIPDQGDQTPFFLINQRALKFKLTGKAHKSIILCDEEALLNYLRDTYNIKVSSKCPRAPSLADLHYATPSPPLANLHNATPSPPLAKLHNATPSPPLAKLEIPTQIPPLTYHNGEGSLSPKFDVAVLMTSDAETSLGLVDFLESCRGSQSQWPCLQNVNWYPLAEPEDGANYIEYLESHKLSTYDVVIILASKYIRDFDVYTAAYCEKRHLHYLFVRVDRSLGRVHQDADTVAKQRREHWMERFLLLEKRLSPQVATSRSLIKYFHIDDCRRLTEMLSLSGVSQALLAQEIELLEHIRDLMKRRSAPCGEISPCVPLNSIEAPDQIVVPEVSYKPVFPTQDQTPLKEESRKQAPADGPYLRAGREIAYGKNVRPKS